MKGYLRDRKRIKSQEFELRSLFVRLCLQHQWPVVAIHQPKRKRSTCVVLYGCALFPEPILELVDFCFLSDFRIKQVLNLQLPPFVTTDRWYSKCSGVGRVQLSTVCVWSHLGISTRYGCQFCTWSAEQGKQAPNYKQRIATNLTSQPLLALSLSISQLSTTLEQDVLSQRIT